MISPNRFRCASFIACFSVCLSLSEEAFSEQSTLIEDSSPLNDEPVVAAGAARRQSLHQIRYANIVRQELDFSCGAAAVATLLTYYFGDLTPEKEVLELLTDSLSADENRQRAVTGFSLLDLKNAVEAKGYDAAGYRLTFEQLRQLASPVIVYVEPLGYKHFAVLRGVVGERVWLADPSRGNLRMSASRFEEEWQGIAFVLGKSGKSDIGLHPLSLSQLRDTLIDKLRIHRQLDTYDRLLSPRVTVPEVMLR